MAEGSVQAQSEFNWATDFDTFINSREDVDYSDSADLPIGYTDNPPAGPEAGPEPGSSINRTLLRFSGIEGAMAGKTLLSASLVVYEIHTPSCQPRPVSVLRITSQWDSNVRWGNQPTASSPALDTVDVAKGATGCPAGPVSFNVTEAVSRWRDGSWPNHGFMIMTPNEGDSLAYKVFASSETLNDPYLSVSYTTNPPSITSVSDSPDPIAAGNTVSFSIGWTDSDPQDSVRAVICKTDTISAGVCTGGEWASGPLTSTSPATATHATSPSELGSNVYYAFACDGANNCSTPLAGVFNVVPNSAAPTATSAIDLPDPSIPGETIDFEVEWIDPDPGDASRAVICKTNDIQFGTCQSGKWASGSLEGESPSSASYTATSADVGTNSYFAFVCDSAQACSSSIAGLFTVQRPPTILGAGDSPDPAVAGETLTFSVSWSDPDVGDSVRAVICKQPVIGRGGCADEAWTVGEYSTTSPSTASLAVTSTHSGVNDYHAYACDAGGACSSGISGTFTIFPSVDAIEDPEVTAEIIARLTGTVLDPATQPLAPPEPTLSRYVEFAPGHRFCEWGTDIAFGQRNNSDPDDAFVLLHFYAPLGPNKLGPGKYGATRSGAQDEDTTEIRFHAQDMGRCWHQNRASGTKLKIAIGTTSDNAHQGVTSDHGEKWANMIKRANEWAANNGYASNGRLTFNGAFDAEHIFPGGVQRAKSWMRGYRSVQGAWNVFFYGDAEGCPSDKAPESECAWDRDDILYLAWKSGMTTAFPQIYDEVQVGENPPTSVNAQQWEKLSRRSFNQGDGNINFAGGLSQRDICLEDPGRGGCEGASLSAQDAWRHLWREINCVFENPADCKTGDALRWATSMADDD